VLFGKGAAARVADAVRWQESYPQSRKPTRGVPAAPGRPVLWARITGSEPDANGFYVGVITQRNPDGSYTDFPDEIAVQPINDEALASGSRYSVQAVDPNYANGAAFQVVGGGIGGGFLGAGGRIAGNQTLTTGNMTVLNPIALDFVTDVQYQLNAGGQANLNISFDGWYRLEMQVTFDTNATGIRRLEITNESVSPAQRLVEATCVPVSGNYTVLYCARTVFLQNSNDLFYSAYQNSGGNLNMLCVQSLDAGFTEISGSWFTVQRLG
jgi:hypothetical protein